MSCSAYVIKIRDGGGLKTMHGVVPRSVTESLMCGSYCAYCALLIKEFERSAVTRVYVSRWSLAWTAFRGLILS